MFPCKQVFRLAANTPVYLDESSVSDTGVVSTRSVLASSVSLPDASLFDLKNLLEAKVDLKSVPCRVISSSVPSFDSIGTKEEVEQLTKNSVSNSNKENN